METTTRTIRETLHDGRIAVYEFDPQNEVVRTYYDGQRNDAPQSPAPFVTYLLSGLHGELVVRISE